ncbi:MAG: helix-turn-helix domain-containing protein [Deltaproteobacteria bacterium]|nr:helix-turn-helix domain-containing protein [Deltaproteobacteria bacterium]
MRRHRPSHVRALREPLGLTQSALAEQIGISRQALAAIEAGRSTPSVVVALRLAEALQQPVEALFGQPGAAAHLTRGERAVVMGCAPALALLGAWWVHASSRDALATLGAGHVHVAGVHATSIEEIRAAVESPFVIALTRWDAGLAVPRGNPKALRAPADLARRGVRIAGRAPGTGARRWLDAALGGDGLRPEQVLARSWTAPGHVEAAQAVALGTADVGITIRPAAIASGVDFVPLVEERFDLVVDDAARSDPRVGRVLDIVNARRFAKDLEALGYDASCAGHRVWP